MADHDLIWEIYDNYRTTRLNVKYYGIRLEKIVIWNRYSEIAIAIAAPGSALTGAWFLKTTNGLIAWQVISSIAACVAFFKPFFRLAERIKFFEQTLSGYRALEQDLYEVVLKIKQDDGLTVAANKMFEAAMKKKRILVTTPPENSEDKNLIAKLCEEVMKEIPSSSLYLPEEDKNGNKQTTITTTTKAATTTDTTTDKRGRGKSKTR